MKKRLLLTVAAVIGGLILSEMTTSAQLQRRAQRWAPKAPVATAAVEQALLEALTGPDGEYAAYAEYEAIIKKFGDVYPYAAILQAEARHIAALKRQMELRGLTVPENPYLDRVTAPDTLKAAAEAGVAAEERNVAMYDRLLKQVQDQPGPVQVFTHLQYCSQERHLPAFKAAAQNDGQLEPGQYGCGMGGGRDCGGPPPWAGGQGRGMRQGGGMSSQGRANGCPLQNQ